MDRRAGLALIAPMVVLAVLVACGGGSATDTPTPPAPTVVPTAAAALAPTATGSVAQGTNPAGSATGVSGATAAPTTSTGSATSIPVTRPVGSATTVIGGTAAAGSAAAPGATGPASSGVAGTGTGTVAPSKPYTDQNGRFSFSRPANWTEEPPQQAEVAAQFTSMNPFSSVSVATQPLPPNVTPDQYAPLALARVKETIPDVALIGTTALTLGGEQAVQAEYTGTVSGIKLYFSQILTAHKGTAYVLTLAAQPADIDAAKQQAMIVIQSWKFLT
jgi:hypothetical protein